MSAKDSVTSARYSWLSGTSPDFAGVSYPGPNTATNVYVQSLYDDGVGSPGPAGPPGDPLDPTVGGAAFTGNTAGTVIRTLTLEAGKHYLVAFHGLSYSASLADGARSRAFDHSFAVSTLTGSAVIQSPVVGRSLIASGYGEIEYTAAGLVVTATVYGGPLDTEWMGPLEVVREYDPAVQIDGWYPTDEADCMFCWDANVGTTLVTSDVSAWSGQVGAVTATAASARPSIVSARASLNNQPAVLFDPAANEKLLIANLSHAASDYSFFVALDQVALDGDSYLFDHGVSPRLVLAPDRPSTAIAYNDGSFHAGNAAAATGAQSIGWILDGSAANQASIRKNRVAVATGQSYTRVALGAGTAKLGSAYTGTTSGLLSAYVAFFCGFASVDPARRFKTEKYMLERFGV